MVNLIDADMIHYSVGWAVKDGEVEDAYQKVDEFISWIEEHTGCTESRLFIQGEGNFRRDILPEYKANRTGKPKPTHHKAIRDYIVNTWDAVIVDGEEVDDRLGYEQCEDTIICSGDKDLDCIPGKHFNWSGKYKGRGVYNVSPIEADRFFFTQCLIGDSTDNIPGLKRTTGKIATKKIKAPIQNMESPLNMYDYVNSVYGGSDWFHIAGCLWIRRKPLQMWEDVLNEIRGGQPEPEVVDNGSTEEVLVEEPEEKDNP